MEHSFHQPIQCCQTTNSQPVGASVELWVHMQWVPLRTPKTLHTDLAGEWRIDQRDHRDQSSFASAVNQVQVQVA